ncbi:MAG TPA: energy transducer TonB [Methylophilus sp.]|nr:energy transducer TonB [Methylophilus sp.]
MFKRESITGLPLRPARAQASKVPELSLHHRQSKPLIGVFGWPALATEAWLKQDKQKRWSWAGMLAVVLLHATLIWWMLIHTETPVIPPKPEPMTVSLITLPAKKEEAPAPEIVPIIKQKPVEKPIIKPKEPTVKPVERPTPVVERIVEPTSDTPRFEASTQPAAPPMEAPAAASAKPAPAPAAPPKQEIVEEKEEPPKFGVAYLNNPPPEYPKLAKRAGEEGRVLLKVLVSAEGRPETVEISKGSGFERLDTAAMNAVKQWRFEPARKGGKTLSAYVIVPLAFTLN